MSRESGPSDAPTTTLVIWDYDWSLINCNSDTFVVEALRPELAKHFDDDSLGWTALMDAQMQRLWDSGVTSDEITSVVAGVPVFPGCLEAVKACATLPEVKQVIVSDANSVFIEAFLDSRGLRNVFHGIITNPAEFDEHGRLHVRPHAAYQCPLCPENLCKGAVLEALVSELAPKRVLYVGDGGGDFCPACDLRRSDTVFCRAPPSPPLTHFGLHRRIQSQGSSRTRHGDTATVCATVRPWSSGEELLKQMMIVLQPP